MRALNSISVLRSGTCVLLGLVLIAAIVPAAGASSITIRSGNALIGQPDPLIRYLAEPSGVCGNPFASAFSAADFAAAAAGPNANVILNYPVWGVSLPCDPLAQWIAPNLGGAPQSALFAYEFNVPEPCCIASASMNFCWSQDDWLGDLDTFTNPGVFLNGTPLSISGGNYATETQALVDVTGILQCGLNTLYIYNRDAACVVSGLIFSATFDIIECTVPVQPSSWGSVKALYH